METFIRGYSEFYQGEFEDKEKQDSAGQNVKISFYQLGVMNRTETGLQLVKVSVPKEKVEEAKKCHGQNVQILAELKETNYSGKKGNKFIFLQAGKAA